MLELSQRNLLIYAGLSVVEYNAVGIKFSDSINLPEKSECAIFTSKNAFRAIHKRVCIKNAFCVGEKTGDMLRRNNIVVRLQRNSSKALAETILEDYSKNTFDFFCGNKRRPELLDVLSKNGIRFNEVVVYQTEPRPKQFDSSFDGILFFSPSGVQSYLEMNEPNQIPVFCIGNTTAAEARQYFEDVNVANSPKIENVIAKAASFFKHKKSR
jgi:uroporphyrinogen-III synthase